MICHIIDHGLEITLQSQSKHNGIFHSSSICLIPTLTYTKYITQYNISLKKLMDQDYTLKHLFNGNHYYFSTFLKCCYIICKPNCDILHTHARIGTNSLVANTTWIFSRISNLTLVHLTSHDLLFPMFTL